MHPMARPCLKCGSRDHESCKCPKNQEHRSCMAHGMNFTASCLGVDEMNSNGVTAEVFSCENLACGRVLLDCGATDTVGSVEASEATIDKSQKAFGKDHDWVSVDPNDRPVYKFGGAKREQALSKVKSECNQEVTWHICMCMPRKRKECLYCCLPSHSLHWEQSSTSRRVM